MKRAPGKSGRTSEKDEGAKPQGLLPAPAPRAHASLAEGAAPAVEDTPLPDAVARRPVEQKSPAEWAYQRIILYIKHFEEQLDRDQEVVMGLVGAEAGVLRIEGVGFFAPDLLTFYGAGPDGSRMQLVQHVSQLNMVLRAVPRHEGPGAPRRIGFRLAADLDRRAAEAPEDE